MRKKNASCGTKHEKSGNTTSSRLSISHGQMDRTPLGSHPSLSINPKRFSVNCRTSGTAKPPRRHLVPPVLTELIEALPCHGGILALVPRGTGAVSGVAGSGFRGEVWTWILDV